MPTSPELAVPSVLRVSPSSSRKSLSTQRPSVEVNITTPSEIVPCIPRLDNAVNMSSKVLVVVMVTVPTPVPLSLMVNVL